MKCCLLRQRWRVLKTLASPLTKNRISLKWVPSSTIISPSWNLHSFDMDETTRIINLSYFYLQNFIPRSKDDSKKNYSNKGCFLLDSHTYWTPPSLSSAASQTYPLLSLLLWAHRRLRKLTRMSPLPHKISAFLSSFPSSSPLPRSRRPQGRCRRTSRNLPYQRRFHQLNGWSLRGRWGVSRRWRRWCRRRTWWRELSGWGESYFEGGEEKFFFMIIDFFVFFG